MAKVGRRVGRSITAFFIIIGIIMCIPGILMLVLSSSIYGQPITETGQQFNTYVGYNSTIQLVGVMKQGENYDIRIEITVSATPNNPPNGGVTIRMTVQKTGTDLASLPSTYDFSDTNFNSTFLSKKYEFKEDFVSDADATFNFEIISSNNLTNIYIKIFLYENPRRVLASIATTIGLILLIPGGLVLVSVACISSCGRRR
jgi:hypothetical protein